MFFVLPVLHFFLWPGIFFWKGTEALQDFMWLCAYLEPMLRWTVWTWSWGHRFEAGRGDKIQSESDDSQTHCPCSPSSRLDPGSTELLLCLQYKNEKPHTELWLIYSIIVLLVMLLKHTHMANGVTWCCFSCVLSREWLCVCWDEAFC